MGDLVELPQPFIDSDDWRSLSDEDRLSLLRRLEEIASLGRDLASGKRLAEFVDLAEFADDLELDVSILQELDIAQRGGLSRWQIHHSWSFETSPSELVESLPPDMLEILNEREPRHDAPLDEYRSWFGAIGSQLVLGIEHFKSSRTYSSAIAMHVVLDVLLSRLLSGLYKLRLNRAIPR